MAITYDAPSNTITVTGYTEETPCTFEDILRENDAQGWDVVDSTNGIQFLFDCKLTIGDGVNETHLSDKLKQIHFSESSVTSVGQKLILVKNNAYFTSGELISTTDKSGKNGNAFHDSTTYLYGSLVEGYAGSTVYLYSSLFSRYPRLQSSSLNLEGEGRIWNCLYENGNGIAARGDLDVNDFALSGTINGLAYGTVGGTYNDIKIHEADYGLYFYHNRNFDVYNCIVQKSVLFDIRCNIISVDVHIIDSVIEDWSIDWLGVSTAKVYRQYTFNLLVKDSAGDPINGVTATLTDKDDGVVFSVATAGVGTIAEQTVSRGYYDQANGDVLQDYGPFVLTLTKTGYKPLTIEGIVLADPIDWTLELLEWGEVLTDKVAMTVELADMTLTTKISDQSLEVIISG